LQVVTELKNCDVKDIFIACVDGLKAIESVFPQSEVQLCIVHLVRHSLNYAGWKTTQGSGGGLKDDLHRRDRSIGRTKTG